MGNITEGWGGRERGREGEKEGERGGGRERRREREEGEKETFVSHKNILISYARFSVDMQICPADDI